MNDKQQLESEADGNLGLKICVLERGFVYVGAASVAGDFLRLANVRNIRRWGTTKGLGELANGPLPKTQVDPCGDLLIPLRSVIFLMRVEKGW